MLILAILFLGYCLLFILKWGRSTSYSMVHFTYLQVCKVSLNFLYERIDLRIIWSIFFISRHF